MINIKGKYIPKKFFAPYTRRVKPDAVNARGEEIFIPREKQTFHFRMVLDAKNNMYFLPLVEVPQPKGASVVDPSEIEREPAYKIEDIIEAAAGDKVKQAKIESCHRELRERYGNQTVMSEAFIQDMYAKQVLRDMFVEDYNDFARSRPAGTMPTITAAQLPAKATTVESLTPAKITNIAAIARFPAGQTPSTPTGGQAQ